MTELTAADGTPEEVLPGDPAVTAHEPPETPEQEGNPEETPETFPREYVEKLRQEAAESRTKAKRADDLAARLHTALVTATGRMADPTDLPFDEAHLEDPEALTAAIESLLASKPHLATRTPRGDIGQGPSVVADSVSLAGLLRAGAN